jgi:hypothetical protein
LTEKEGLNAESLLVPVAGFSDQYHIRDQVDGFLALGFPPSNSQDRTVGLMRERDIVQPAAVSRPHIHFVEREAIIFIADHGVFRGATNVLPTVGAKSQHIVDTFSGGF